MYTPGELEARRGPWSASHPDFAYTVPHRVTHSKPHERAKGTVARPLLVRVPGAALGLPTTPTPNNFCAVREMPCEMRTYWRGRARGVFRTAQTSFGVKTELQIGTVTTQNDESS